MVDGQVTAGPDPSAGRLPGRPGGGRRRPHRPAGRRPRRAGARCRTGTWPDAEAVQLELRAGEGAPRVAAAQRRVRVRLPKGTVVTAELSSAPDAAFLEHMALGQGLDADATRRGPPRASTTPSRPGGRSRWSTPCAQPVDAPLFGPMTGTRTAVGQTDVVIDGTLGVHRASTEHVVLRSRWLDPVDDPAVDEPTER